MLGQTDSIWNNGCNFSGDVPVLTEANFISGHREEHCFWQPHLPWQCKLTLRRALVVLHPPSSPHVPHGLLFLHECLAGQFRDLIWPKSVRKKKKTNKQEDCGSPIRTSATQHEPALTSWWWSCVYAGSSLDSGAAKGGKWHTRGNARVFLHLAGGMQSPKQLQKVLDASAGTGPGSRRRDLLESALPLKDLSLKARSYVFHRCSSSGGMRLHTDGSGHKDEHLQEKEKGLGTPGVSSQDGWTGVSSVCCGWQGQPCCLSPWDPWPWADSGTCYFQIAGCSNQRVLCNGAYRIPGMPFIIINFLIKNDWQQYALLKLACFSIHSSTCT